MWTALRSPNRVRMRPSLAPSPAGRAVRVRWASARPTWISRSPSSNSSAASIRTSPRAKGSMAPNRLSSISRGKIRFSRPANVPASARSTRPLVRLATKSAASPRSKRRRPPPVRSPTENGGRGRSQSIALGAGAAGAGAVVAPGGGAGVGGGAASSRRSRSLIASIARRYSSWTRSNCSRICCNSRRSASASWAAAGAAATRVPSARQTKRNRRIVPSVPGEVDVKPPAGRAGAHGMDAGIRRWAREGRAARRRGTAPGPEPRRRG